MATKKRASAPDDDRPDRDLLDDPDLIEFTSRLPEARKVSIKAMGESGTWRYKGAISIDSFNLDNVQRRYGGGTYQFSIHGADGKLLKTITNIEIDDLPDDERTPEPAKTAAAAPAVSELQLIREQMRDDRAMMMELIRSIGKSQPAQQQSDITQLVTALATLRGMEPKHTNPPEVQELLMKSFTNGLELAAKVNKTANGGEQSALGEVFSFVREVFQDARPLIQSALEKAGHPAAAPKTVQPGTTITNPPAVIEEEEDDVTEDLRPALAFVKDQLKSGLAPQALAEIVLAQMQNNPEMDDVVSGLIADSPIEDFLEMEPELKAEPLRTTFGQFFGVMRARIFAARDSGRSGGNAANVRPDAQPDSIGN